jgi:threonine synthase
MIAKSVVFFFLFLKKKLDPYTLITRSPLFARSRIIQDIVKSLFNDTDFNSTYRLGAINSINWARILAQIVYYFSSYYALRPTLKPHQTLQFVVPTGNFGDILAGFYAHKLGLPMGINGKTPGLVIATNSNDILTRYVFPPRKKLAFF